MINHDVCEKVDCKHWQVFNAGRGMATLVCSLVFEGCMFSVTIYEAYEIHNGELPIDCPYCLEHILLGKENSIRAHGSG